LPSPQRATRQQRDARLRISPKEFDCPRFLKGRTFTRQETSQTGSMRLRFSSLRLTIFGFLLTPGGGICRPEEGTPGRSCSFRTSVTAERRKLPVVPRRRRKSIVSNRPFIRSTDL